jgi:hypothetical protein
VVALVGAAAGTTMVGIIILTKETLPLLKEEEAIIAQALWVDHIQIHR